MKKLAQKILLLSVSLTVSLFLAEHAVSLLRPQNLSGSWGEQTERGLIVNKSAGTARHQYGARVVRYHFTAPHLRAPAPTASTRVLVLGDSYAFGYLLDEGDAPVSLLQAKLDAEFGRGVFSLLNAAVGGWGAADYVAFVEDFGEEIAPDVVLVFLNTDDIGRALRSPLWDYRQGDARLTRAAVPRSKLKLLVNGFPAYQWLLEHSHLLQLARNQAEIRSKRTLSSASTHGPLGPKTVCDTKTARYAGNLGAALFRRLQAWCRERRVRLLVTTTGWHSPPYSDPSEATESFMSGAESLFLGLGVPYSDPSGRLRRRMGSAVDRYTVPGDYHPNEAGAALIADHVYPFVASELRKSRRVTRGLHR